MEKAKILRAFLVFSLALFLLIPTARAEERFRVTFEELSKHKGYFDDPRPFLNKLSYKKILPPDVYSKLTYDVEAMKALWAELIGFKAPDLVGKIAPEIQPGIYTYKDKEKYQGFKELMYPDLYNRFKPGEPPHVGNFPEIKVVPTRQYYWALPIAEATKKNIGFTKQDENGYLLYSSYIAGYPFPMPSGKFKAQQIIYNWEKRYFAGENSYRITQMRGFTKNLKMDFDGLSETYSFRLHGRVLTPPYGWFDDRAKQGGEDKGYLMKFLAPRDSYGTVVSNLAYLDPNHFDQFMIYVNVLRRIRKMSATDTQDPVGGQDMIYEDVDSFQQKLSSTRYPYKFELIAEREYLVPSPILDGSGYLSSKGMEFRNYEFERRPLYVIKLTQLDKNYVYGQRILYIDKETFLNYHIENYDQKGRLYRSTDLYCQFVPEAGMFHGYHFLSRDYLDLHSSLGNIFETPAPWLTREETSLQGLVTKGK